MLRARAIRLPEDRETVVTFRRDSFLVSYGDLSWMGSDEAYLGWLASMQAAFPDGFLLFEEGGAPVAQLEMRPRDFDGRRMGYVNLYYVRPTSRRQGHGRALHEHAVQTFTRLGCRELRLKVSASNAGARRFYDRLGFREVGREHDAQVILMESTLT